jgi:hypothetical protein
MPNDVTTLFEGLYGNASFRLVPKLTANEGGV